MNFKELTLASFAAALVLSTGCVVDDDPVADTDDTDPGTTMTVTDPTTMGPTGPTTETSSSSTTTVDPDTTDTDTDTDGDTDTDTDTDDIDPDLYDFREDEADAYTQLERMGFPGVTTALIAEANKDAYNAATPVEDIAGDFSGDVIATLNYLHDGAGDGNGLEDDVEGAIDALFADFLEANPDIDAEDLMCSQPSTGAINDTCVSQGGPFIFPDVLVVNTMSATGFPLNGRGLEAPVIDIILAVLLLDVLDETKAPNPITLNAFADLDPAEGSQGLSQSGNDLDFSATFPYLAAAHE